MEHAPSFVEDLAIVLLVAGATSVIFRLLRQPPMLGYLVAGAVVGPHTPLPVFADAERTQSLSELGVILVMFSIGLEFSLRKLMKVLPTSGLSALIQTSTAVWAGFALGRAFGWTVTEGVFLGAGLAISGNGLGRSVRAGLSLGQIGEFSFIMIGIGTAAGVVRPSLLPTLVTVAAVTAFTTPTLVRISNRVVVALDHALPQRFHDLLAIYASWFEDLRTGPRLPSSRMRRYMLYLGLDAALLLLLLWLGARSWRESVNLHGHVRAGAQVVLELLSKPAAAEHDFEDIEELLPGLGHITGVELKASCAPVGLTLAELDLRARTGATIVAIRRGKQGLVLPGSGEHLQAGDIVALTGTTEAIGRAAALLRDQRTQTEDFGPDSDDADSQTTSRSGPGLVTSPAADDDEQG